MTNTDIAIADTEFTAAHQEYDGPEVIAAYDGRGAGQCYVGNCQFATRRVCDAEAREVMRRHRYWSH